MDNFRYDVAISFLSRDEKVAAALADGLQDSLEVFFFPRNQEELAATDGLQSMRAPFFNQARIAVVLFGAGWGDTPWTGVEAMAIRDRCLQDQFRSLVFVVLDKSANLPSWLPHSHVWLSYPDFGLAQTLGVIKARVREHGGQFRPASAADRARSLRREQDHAAEKRSLFQSPSWITSVAHAARDEILDEVKQLADEISNDGVIAIRSGRGNGQCVLTNNRVSVAVRWQQKYMNVLETVSLIAAAFDSQLALPDERLLFVEPLRETSRLNICPDLSEANELCWYDGRKPDQRLDARQIADKCVQLFLDAVRKADHDDQTRAHQR